MLSACGVYTNAGQRRFRGWTTPQELGWRAPVVLDAPRAETHVGSLFHAREARGQASKGLEGEVELVPAAPEHGASASTDARRALRSRGCWGAKAILVDAYERTPFLPFDVLEFAVAPPVSAGLRMFRERRSSTGFAPQAPSRSVSIPAPAGYGKTTLLAQWAERDARPFAWVTVDERDNDPFVFLKARHRGRRSDRAARRRRPGGIPTPPNETIWEAVAPRLSVAL